MKIVSGKYGSRKIRTLKGEHTRPTSSKIRAAVFDHFGSFFDEGSFLDVFSGSGAMAFEAISRGFNSAYLIEKDFRSLQVIESNINTLGLGNQVQLVKGRAEKSLKLLNRQFNLIYIDPPYGYKNILFIFELINSLELLKDKGYCVFETNSSGSFEDIPGLNCYQVKKYGQIYVYFYQKA